MTKFSTHASLKSDAHKISQPVIAQILPALDLGGVERGTIEMAKAIIAAGGKAVVISSGGQLVPQLQRIGAVHITLPVHVKNPFKWGRIRRQLKSHLREQGVDIVHVRSRAPAWIALPAARALGLKTVSTIHGKFKAGWFLKRFYNRKILRADKLIAISDFVKETILNQHKFPGLDEKLTVIPRGVDIAYFDPAAVTQARIVSEAQRLALPDDRPVMMLPARPTGWKGHKILIDAVSRMSDKHFTLVLLGASGGPYKYQEMLEEQIMRLGLAGVIRLASQSKDMPASLMLADVVVMPSIEPEPFGRVALEGQAMGRPVVAFGHGGALESIQDGETGFLVPPGDVAALATTLETALALGPRKRKAWATKARAHIEEQFTTALMCERTLAIYDALLTDR